MGLKITTQSAIDRFQFMFDVFSGLKYQPLPWIGLPKAKRASGTHDRWKIIEAEIDQNPCTSAMDVGSNVGFFLFSLAKKGITTVGVETHDSFFRISQYARKKMDLSNTGILNMEVNPTTLDLLPEVDTVIFLSVFHHWTKYFGFDEATKMLRALWQRCRIEMYFETGEAEMPEEYNLPNMHPSTQQWLETYLLENCSGSKIKHLGQFKAFAPGGDEKKNVVKRNLFVVRRI